MSKVQFNLLPDSKLTFNRNQNTKRVVYSIATIASVVSIGILLIMFLFVNVVQKNLMNNAAKNVDSASSKLQSQNIDKIITVQSQLQALPALHQNKNITSRIFTYLPKVTPTNVSINKLDLELVKYTMTISGTADSQKDVNTFVDTLKYSTYKVGPSSPAPAFKNVVETGFNLNANGVGYTIDMQFDPKLFANNIKDVNGKVLVPQITVNNPAGGGSAKSPSSTLFNSSQSSAGSN